VHLFEKERALPSRSKERCDHKSGAEDFFIQAPIARDLFQKIVRHLDEVVLNVESACEAEINLWVGAI
jgi:hypothetical protein